jgi:glycerol-3-phosphate dehydrogenase
VGAAVTYTLARRGVPTVVLEADSAFGLAASGTNSGILHTGFDSTPGELETQLILRAAELRDALAEDLRFPVERCGALLQPRDDGDTETIRALAATARENGVEVHLGDDGVLCVPGESITDPVHFVNDLVGAAQRHGAEYRVDTRVDRIARVGDGLALGLAGGGEIACRVAVNCAGLYADEVARMAGDDSFSIHPRKGEFFVFAPPEPPEHILLPVPTKRTKGVLVFPTVDGHVVAGPTAHDQEDKEDWTVRPEAYDEVMAKARAMWPPLKDCEPIASYAGLRPGGRNGANYVIGPAHGCPELINVAAIRSTGLTASLGIAEHVSRLVAAQGIELGEPKGPFTGSVHHISSGYWWQMAAVHRGLAT